MSDIPHDLPYDSRLARMRKRLQGLQRVAAAINDLYIYGVYPSNYPNLTTVLEQAKDHTKNIIKETKDSKRQAKQRKNQKPYKYSLETKANVEGMIKNLNKYN